MVILAHAPPLPFLEASWHGRAVAILALCWCGDPQRGAQVTTPLRQFGQPLVEHVGPMPYVQWQHLQDAGAPPGRCQYWKTANFVQLEDAVIAMLAAAAPALPTPETEIHVHHLGGAVARVPAAETAFARRDAGFFVNLIGVTPWHEELAALRTSIRKLYSRVSLHALPELQPNFSARDDGHLADYTRSDFAARLESLRARCDPAGAFVRV